MSLVERDYSLGNERSIGGGTSIYEVPAGFAPGYQLLAKLESYHPPLKLFELPLCTQDGIKVFLQARGFSNNISETIAEAVSPDLKKKPDPDNFIKVISLKDREAAVIFTGNKEHGLENIYVINQDPEPGKIGREQLPVPEPGQEIVIEVDFSQLQKRSQPVVLFSCYPSREKISLVPEPLVTPEPLK